MAVRNMTIAVPEELIELLSEAAEDEQITLSELIVRAAERELTRRGARKVPDRWQAQLGRPIPDELLAANAEIGRNR